MFFSTFNTWSSIFKEAVGVLGWTIMEIAAICFGQFLIIY